MNQFALTQAPKYHDETCGDLMRMAERELAAFFRAVTELFGTKEAMFSTEEWLHELVASQDLPSSILQLRSLTVQIATRLALRVTASPGWLASSSGSVFGRGDESRSKVDARANSGVDSVVVPVYVRPESAFRRVTYSLFHSLFVAEPRQR